MGSKNVKIILGIIALVIIVPIIGIFSYLVSKVSYYHHMACDMKPYEQNSFINCGQYVWLSPYRSDVYDQESGETIDPEYSFSRGCFALAGHYSYEYYRNDRKTGAQGVYYVYFGFDTNGFYIEDIDYEV